MAKYAPSPALEEDSQCIWSQGLGVRSSWGPACSGLWVGGVALRRGPQAYGLSLNLQQSCGPRGPQVLGPTPKSAYLLGQAGPGSRSSSPPHFRLQHPSPLGSRVGELISWARGHQLFYLLRGGKGGFRPRPDTGTRVARHLPKGWVRTTCQELG